MHTTLKKDGIHPVLHKLGNECPKEIISAITTNNMKFQLAPPGDHRTNPAERAVQTFKNHFIYLVYGIDEKFPVNQCDRLIKHAVVTLNILRSSRINPLLSAYNQLYGNFYFNTTPLILGFVLMGSIRVV